MAEPVTTAKVSVSAASFIKKYWHIFLILLFVIVLVPPLIFTIAINILFPQASREEFKVYKELTEGTDINWASFMAYDVVRLDNYLKANKPNESVFDFLKVNFKEYQIIETKKEITEIVDGKQVMETIIEKEYKLIRELELQGYLQIKELLESLEYDTSEENMTVKKVIDFFSSLNEEEEYKVETAVFTDDEIERNFDDIHKQWFSGLTEILPLLDPSSEFSPDEYVFNSIITNPDIPSIWPTTGIVTSEFGEKRLNEIHKGIDIANNIGIPVYSTANGTVIAVGMSGNYGKRIMIYHGRDEKGNTYITIYAHLSEFKVSLGQKVSKGDLIGLMGSTGYSTGPHLHYEVIVNGINVNPRYFLP